MGCGKRSRILYRQSKIRHMKETAMGPQLLQVFLQRNPQIKHPYKKFTPMVRRLETRNQYLLHHMFRQLFEMLSYHLIQHKINLSMKQISKALLYQISGLRLHSAPGIAYSLVIRFYHLRYRRCAHPWLLESFHCTPIRGWGISPLLEVFFKP